jgi:hypothetical protein
MHVTEVLGVFDAGAGSTAANRLDAAQPNAIATPTASATTAPQRSPTRPGSQRHRDRRRRRRPLHEPGSLALDLGPRSVALQSWFGMKRVDDTDTDVTLTDPTGHVVDTEPRHGPYTGAVNGEWLTARSAPASRPTPAARRTTTSPTRRHAPGADRYFTYGPPHYSEKGWPIARPRRPPRQPPDPALAVLGLARLQLRLQRLRHRRHVRQIVINRNGIIFGSVPEVDLPGPQDIDGPDASGTTAATTSAPPGTSRSSPAPTSSPARRSAALQRRRRKPDSHRPDTDRAATRRGRVWRRRTCRLRR